MYRKKINSVESVQTLYSSGQKDVEVLLEVGNIYKVVFDKPTTNKDRKNNDRIIEILGFTDDFMGDVIVRYLDNNRRGRVAVNCLLPYEVNRIS